jgi:hypothetical protein
MNIILKTIDDDIKLCEVYANYWMAMATTGVTKNRRISHGTKGPEFTDDEKVADAMLSANTHMTRMRELMDQKKSLIHEQEFNEECEAIHRIGLRGDPQ